MSKPKKPEKFEPEFQRPRRGRMSPQARERKRYIELVRRIDSRLQLEAAVKDATNCVEGGPIRESMSEKIARVIAQRNHVPMRDFIAARKAAARLNKRSK